jgi:8-oxo-dGTP pyrophosphatase MutT (NUDIX family)
MKDNFEQNSLKGIKDPKICYTAGGVLIDDGKVLLIKHKKLGIWLNPGGHVDEGELPHETAEREFFEETGVKVKAVDVWNLPIMNNEFSLLNKGDDRKSFKPNPISTNLHWVNKESYKLRLASDNKDKRFPTKVWKRGCEQHVGFFYMLKAVDGVKFKQNIEETDGIAWFGLDEIDELETRDNIKQEIKMSFRLLGISYD